MVVTSLQFQPLHRWSCVLNCTYEAHLEAHRDPELGILMAGSRAMFGPSGGWAAIIDEGMSMLTGYAIIGGEQSFMNRLIELRGGEERMRESFLRLLDDPEIGKSITPDFRAALLADVGW
jgi:hypothetical protein